MLDYLLLRHRLFLVFILGSSVILAQKKKIGPHMYDEWKKIESVQQTESGNWISYEVTPLEGDGTLIIQSSDGSKTQSVDRGTNAKLHYQGLFVVYLINPLHDSIRQLKLEKVKKEKFPKDTLAIYWTGSDSTSFYPKVKNFKIPSNGDWIAYLSTDDLRPKPKTKKKKRKRKKKKRKKHGFKRIETSGTTLTVLNPTTKTSVEIHRVTDYTFDRTGKYLAYVSSNKGKKDSLSVHVMDLSNEKVTTLITNQLDIKHLTFDYAGEQLAYLFSADTGKVKNYALSLWEEGMHNSRTVIDSTSRGMPDSWTVSGKFSIYFSRDGTKLFVGTNEIQCQEPKDTLLPQEKSKVDIWHYEDLRIQPEQLNQLKRDANKAYKAVYHIQPDKFIQLETENIETVQTYNHNNASFGLGTNNDLFSIERTWQYPWRYSYYLFNINTGSKELIKDSITFSSGISPSGHFFIWYDPIDSSWMSKDLLSKKEVKLTDNFDACFAADNNGQPTVAYPEGSAGWTMHNGEEYFAVYDKFDIYFLNPNNPDRSFSFTQNMGQESNQRLRLWETERDSLYFTVNDVYIHYVDDSTKDEGFYAVNRDGDQYAFSHLYEGNYKVYYITKAEKSDQVLIRRMNFTTYPDLEITTTDFDNFSKISDVNPQQEEYNWATVEFVEWTAYDSTKLRGLLYKPENFDPNKSYPMIVYYYEMYQNNFHNYYSPKPTASIIYPTEYASNGYIVFIPDIRYEPGHPANSAYNCVVSGTEYLVNKYSWIDSTRLGLQGQSWGGYQTAQLITMTGKYRAAMAGAPVSNMFSAYGGIRWGSGLSRMFQYERTQSRIGYTIWEKPDLYIENSPIFHLPNVTTPLLIMHNDNDGAVPWYQGIELFMGLRRLNKPAWLLNYNDDHHNLSKLPNKRDLSVRMRQFFDHYLQGEPMPEWMKSGLPAVDKGKETGYELEK
ncbi:MAG: S9 family peptidase [Crocinitomicaceae bacterium]|nr:S9 family peptidase [Crocinitomicaceae bacterium]